jgi:hypothetical protein
MLPAVDDLLHASGDGQGGVLDQLGFEPAAQGERLAAERDSGREAGVKIAHLFDRLTGPVTFARQVIAQNPGQSRMNRLIAGSSRGREPGTERSQSL